jgi:hypothetical protein
VVVRIVSSLHGERKIGFYRRSSVLRIGGSWGIGEFDLRQFGDTFVLDDGNHYEDRHSFRMYELPAVLFRGRCGSSIVAISNLHRGAYFAMAGYSFAVVKCQQV